MFPGWSRRRLKVLEVEAPPAQTLPRLSWEEDPVTWLVHELLYCCQVSKQLNRTGVSLVALFSADCSSSTGFFLQAREQQEFDATYEDVSAMLHKFMNQNQSLETGMFWSCPQRHQKAICLSASVYMFRRLHFVSD